MSHGYIYFSDIMVPHIRQKSLPHTFSGFNRLCHCHLTILRKIVSYIRQFGLFRVQNFYIKVDRRVRLEASVEYIPTKENLAILPHDITDLFKCDEHSIEEESHNRWDKKAAWLLQISPGLWIWQVWYMNKQNKSNWNQARNLATQW